MRINKGQFRLTSRRKNIQFDLKRGKGHLLSYIKNRIGWHLYPRIQHISKFPLHVDMEVSNICDLNCPMCYTTTQEFKDKINPGFMDFNLVKKIVDESASYNLYSMRLHSRGEPFLHPKIFEIIKYIKEKGIKEVSSLTHGGTLNEEKFEKLIDLGLDWLTISFDGVGEIYEKIRYPLKFDDAIQKIKNYQEIKKQRGVVKPVIKVQAVWPSIEKNPEEFYKIFNPITDQVASNPLIDYLGNDTDIVYEENFTCPQLWERFVICTDGRVMLCGTDEMNQHIIGDVTKESIYDVWHGKKLNKAREIHMRHMGVKEIEICKYCYLPRKTTKDTTKLFDRLLNTEKYVNREQTIGK